MFYLGKGLGWDWISKLIVGDYSFHFLKLHFQQGGLAGALSEQGYSKYT